MTCSCEHYYAAPYRFEELRPSAGCPSVSARSRGFWLLSARTVTSAPASIRAGPISRSPFCAAACSGAHPPCWRALALGAVVQQKLARFRRACPRRRRAAACSAIGFVDRAVTFGALIQQQHAHPAQSEKRGQVQRRPAVGADCRRDDQRCDYSRLSAAHAAGNIDSVRVSQERRNVAACGDMATAERSVPVIWRRPARLGRAAEITARDPRGASKSSFMSAAGWNTCSALAISQPR